MKKFLVTALLVLASLSARADDIVFPGAVPVETLAKQAVVVEGAGGAVLMAKNADEHMPTSSMSKVMTMYLVFEAIRNGKFTLETPITISEAAWKQPGSRTFLKIGQIVRVEDLIRGVIIQSGNDSAVALAEAVAGSEGAFAGLMNEKAREMGLTNTHFMNATGLPDPDHFSTARDLAVMARALIRDFPEYYHYYSETEFAFNGIKQGNRNPLLYRNIGVDGVKTGHTDDAGYGLISSALRDGRRVLAVVNGLKSMQERADESAKLLDWAYREFGLYTVVKGGEKAGEAKIWLGKQKSVPVGVAESVIMTLPRAERDQVKAEMTIDPETVAPIAKGQPLGKLTVTAPGYDTIERPLVALADVEQLNFFRRTAAKIKRLMGKE